MNRLHINSSIHFIGGGFMMGRFYRYRLPCWMRRCICAIEMATLPILIFQLVRTILFPTTLDILLLGFISGLFIAFYLRWI